ncbi:hypothetical protein L6R49_22100 [Myxococcota bacterium]|nr:hypothetical protein [Myxococcota bacterium]
MSLIGLWMSFAAFAAEPTMYTQRATVELPPTGSALIDLGALIELPTEDLLLVNGAGQAVPWTRLGSWMDETGGFAEVPWELVGRPPTLDRIVIDTRPAGRVIDRIRIDASFGRRGFFASLFSSSTWVVGIDVLDEKGAVVASGLLWRASVAHEDRLNDTIEVPQLPPGQYTLRASQEMSWDGVTVSWAHPVDLEPIVKEYPVSGPTPGNSGTSVYEVSLPNGGMKPDRLELVVSDPRFLRTVNVGSSSLDPWMLGQEVNVGGGAVERLNLEGTAIEHLRIDLNGLPLGDRLILYVEDGRDAPLAISAVRLRLPQSRLIVTDAGQGPHTLYAVPTLADERPYDLVHASVELLRSDPPLAVPAGWGPNPEYNPAAALPESLLRGGPAEITMHKGSRTLGGVAGQATRWSLPPDLLAVAAYDLSDLRVVDAEGRQVPYLIDRDGVRALPSTTTREEQGKTTKLTVRLEQPTIVQRIILRAEDPAFSREVKVEENERYWSRTPDEPSAALALDLSGQVTDRLEILIGNGDDAPMGPITVEVLGPVISVLAVHPGDGARLYYAGEADLPSYDLSLLAPVLLRGALQVGELGPHEVMSPSTDVDKKVAMAAVLVMALVMLGLVAKLVREPDEATPAEPGAPDA